MLCFLYQQDKLSKSDFEESVGEFMEYVDAYVYDCPKIYNYIGSMLSQWFHIDALNIDWLVVKLKLVNSKEAVESVVTETLNNILERYSIEEAKSKWISGKLESILGSDKYQSILSSKKLG